MASAGGLYVEVIPTFAGGAEAIYAEMVAPATEAGARAGASLGQEIVARASGAGAEAGRNVAVGFTEATAAAGVEAGRAIARGAVEGSNGAGAEIGRIINAEALAATGRTGAEIGGLIRSEAVASSAGTGAEIGAEIRTGVAAGAAEGSAAAGTALKAGAAKAGTESGAETGSWFSRTFGASTAGTGDKLVADLQAKLKAASAGVVEAEAAVARAMAGEEAAADKLQLAEARLLETRTRYADGSAAVIAAENRVAAAQREVESRANASVIASNGLSTARDKEQAATKNLEEAESKAIVSKRNLEDATASLIPTAGKLSGEWNKMGVLIGVTVAGAMVGEGVKSAGEYQQALTRLVSSAGELPKNLDEVGDGLKYLSTQVGYSALDLAKGMYTVESAGYHGADGLKIMQAAAEGAKTENADLGVSANAVTTLLQDYHLKADDAAQVTTKLVAAVSDSKTNFQDFTEALHSVSPLASSVGILFSDVGGALASMTSHGMSAQQASQNLAETIRTFQNPSQQMRQELGNLGLSAEDLAQHLGERGITGTMQMVSEQILQRMGPDGKVLMDTFNQSKDAAAGMKDMLEHMPPAAKQAADGFLNGSVSVKQLHEAMKAMPPEQANLVMQFETLHNRAEGFSNQLKRGGSDVQTYASELQKVTGNATTANTVMMTTGENMEYTAKASRDIAAATTEAGNHVKGWHEIQGTFNQRLSEFKAGIGTLAINLGQALLPALTPVVAGIAEFVKFLAGQPETVIAFVGTIAALAGTFGALKLAMAIGNVAKEAVNGIRAVTTAQEALNIAMSANVIGIVALAIAALVAGLVYAYYNFEWFGKTVDAVVHAVGGFFSWLWESALHPVFDAIGVAVGWVVDHWKLLAAAILVILGPVGWVGLAIGFLATHWQEAMTVIATAASWAWENVIKPVFDALSLAARIVAAVVLTVLIAPLVIAWNLLSVAFRWGWENIIKPAWDAIAEGARWLYENALKPVFTFIGDLWEREIRGMENIWNSVLKPAWDAISTAANWLWENALKPVFTFIGDLWEREIRGMENIWNNVLKPVWDAITTAAHWLWENVLKPIFDSIGRAWDDLMKGMTWVWENVLKPAFDAISSAVHSVGDAFDQAVNWIKDTWNRIIDITKTPINFVINTVYNEGIVPTWNAIAGIFDLGKLNTIPGLAGGGIMPGYAPGVDNIPAVLSPGEAVLVPEAVRAIGANNILAMNSYYSGGRPSGSTAGYSADRAGFAGGGVLDSIGSAVAGAGNFIGGLATDAWHGVTDAFGWITSIAGDIAGGVGKLFAPITHTMDGIQMPFGAGGPWKDALSGIPKKVIDSVVKLVTDWFTNQKASGETGALNLSSTAQGAVNIGRDMAAQLGWVGPEWDALYRLYVRESGWNPYAVNASSGAYGIPQALGHGNVFALGDIVGQLNWGYGYIKQRYGDPLAAVAHEDAFGWYDNGGYLQPGVTHVYNGTGKPEPVFTHEQWGVLKESSAAGQGTGGNTINIQHYSNASPESLAHVIDRHLSRNSRMGFSF